MTFSQPPDKIALFGGTFDPIHLGHLKVAEWVRNFLNLDKVIFIPNHIHPFKKREKITPSKYRLKMLELALLEYQDFDLDPVEIDRQGVSYTINTLHYFYKIYPQTELFLLIGADNLLELPKWKNAQEILSLAKIVVCNRESRQSVPTMDKNRFIFLNSPKINISSTDIRERFAYGHSCKNMLPTEVINFIIENKVY